MPEDYESDFDREARDDQDWLQNRKYILEKLNRIENKLDRLEVSVVGLQLKAAGWGFIAGAIPAAVAIVAVIVNAMKK